MGMHHNISGLNFNRATEYEELNEIMQWPRTANHSIVEGSTLGSLQHATLAI
jgi:hypothetical protein